jgi:integrase
MRILTPQQVKDLPTLLHGHPLYAPVLAALHTGMRRALLPCLAQCRSRWKDHPGARSTRRDQNRAALQRAEVRAGVRDVSLPAIVLDVLHERRMAQLERRLMLGQGQAWRRCPRVSAVGQRCAAVAQRLRRDLEQRHQATQHRCLVSRAAAHLRQPTNRRKVPITIIAKRLGHSSPAIRLKVYAHLFREDDSEAAAAIDAVLGG